MRQRLWKTFQRLNFSECPSGLAGCRKIQTGNYQLQFIASLRIAMPLASNPISTHPSHPNFPTLPQSGTIAQWRPSSPPPPLPKPGRMRLRKFFSAWVRAGFWPQEGRNPGRPRLGHEVYTVSTVSTSPIPFRPSPTAGRGPRNPSASTGRTDHVLRQMSQGSRHANP